jgi:hypothetical protein
MKKKPIDESFDSFVKGTMSALKRAGKRARRQAEMTGTYLVVDEGNGIVYLDPKTMKKIPRPKKS